MNKSLEELEYFDMIKSKILKYIFYKKRTEKEIINKFSSIYDMNVLESVIDNLKELGYIDDMNYIERAIKEFMALKSLSIKEIKYKLISKGIDLKLIEKYFSNNYNMLHNYEIESAKKIICKKNNSLTEVELRNYLFKKGYMEDTIKEVL